MKKIILFFSFLALLIAIIYSAGNGLLESSLHSRLNSIPEELRAYGLELRPFTLGSFRVESRNEIVAKDIKSSFTVKNWPIYDPRQTYIFSIGKVSLYSKDYEYTDLTLKVSDSYLYTKISVFDDKLKSVSKNALQSSDKIVIDRFEVPFKSTPSDPEKGTKDLLSRLSSILTSGRTLVEYTLDAQVAINLNEVETTPVPLVTMKDTNGYFLALEKEALINALQVLNIKCSNDEIELIRLSPMRANSLIQTKKYAKNSALSLSRRVPNLNTTYFEEVIWAFILEKRIGKSSKIILDSYTKSLNNEKLQSAKYNFNYGIDKAREGASYRELEAIAETQGRNFPKKSGASYTLR